MNIYLFWIAPERSRLRSSNQGLTLLELLISLAILGFLAALMAPGFNALTNTHQLNLAQAEIYAGIRDARNNATYHKHTWQASFQEVNGIVQWAIHPVGALPAALQWNRLNRAIRLDPDNTTLQSSGGVRRIQFGYEGRTSGQLGRITLMGRTRSQTRRCVIVSTLLGTVRTGREQAKKDDSGRNCY